MWNAWDVLHAFWHICSRFLTLSIFLNIRFMTTSVRTTSTHPHIVLGWTNSNSFPTTHSSGSSKVLSHHSCLQDKHIPTESIGVLSEPTVASTTACSQTLSWPYHWGIPNIREAKAFLDLELAPRLPQITSSLPLCNQAACRFISWTGHFSPGYHEIAFFVPNVPNFYMRFSELFWCIVLADSLALRQGCLSFEKTAKAVLCKLLHQMSVVQRSKISQRNLIRVLSPTHQA